MEQGCRGREKSEMRGSTGDIEKLLKKKRERMEKEKNANLKEEIFRRSRKVVRSPDDKGKQGSKGEEKGGIGGGERAEEMDERSERR